jgi:citrate lyase beta subunit
LHEGKAAINFQNKMVDVAAYRRAKATIERYEALKELNL